MNNKELRKLVNKIALKYFHQKIDSKCDVLFNNLFRTSGGEFSIHIPDKLLKYYNHNELLDLHTRLQIYHKILISPKILKGYGLYTIIGVIKHELVHYFLWYYGYHDFGHNKRFKQILSRIKGSRWTPEPDAQGKDYPLYRCTYCNYWGTYSTEFIKYYKKHHFNQLPKCPKCHHSLFYDGTHTGYYISEIENSENPSLRWFNK